MTPTDRDERQRFERVQALLADALELEASERASFLARACPDDEALRAEVESLLSASEESDEYFGDLAGRAGITMSPLEDWSETGIGLERDHDPHPELIGSTIGRYQVVSWLGRGGMASVYLAERRGDDFTQRVALKVVSKQITDPRIERRTREERRILARLEHRNIARLIDGGLTADGKPFYAMEYVDGIDLLRYSDRERLGVAERLRLFLEVCAPVQFAHERLVVHCDLKPSNILVTDDGHVRLLDFGIARLIDPHSEGDEVTGLWFTPAYASPEQVRREPPGTASDVYSLGVILYEMLTGHRPYRFDERTPEAVSRTVGGVTPVRPSDVVSRAAGSAANAEAVTPEALAAARASTPERMKRLLRGDLDAIVMKALSKEAAERYHTAEQLAADVRRHLASKPLLSVPNTPGYRIAKSLRRNKGIVLAATIVALTLLGGIGATLWQAARATRAAELAREEAANAALVATLMTDLFRLSDPNEVLGDTITARDLLDRGADRIQAELGDQPALQARLLSEVAKVYRNLGLYARAEPLARQSLELRRRVFGTEAVETTESLIQVGMIEADLGRQGDAMESLTAAIELRETLVAFPDRALIDAQSALAWLSNTAQLHDTAVELFTAALQGERALDPEGAGVADMMFGLAATYHDSGMLDRADSLLNSVLDDLDSDARPSPLALGALVNVGMIRRVREQYREAEPLLRAAVTMATNLYGPSHRAVFEAQEDLALALAGTGDWDESERIYRGAIAGSSATLGPTHQVTAGLREALGVLLVDRRQYDEAVGHLQAAVQEKSRRHEGRDHPGIVSSLVRVAEALAGAGRFGEARDYVARAEAMNRRLSTSESVYSISTERTLGWAAAADGDAAAAERHFRNAIDLAERLLDRPDHRYTVQAKRDYGVFLTRLGRGAEAGELLRWVLDARIDNLGEPHPLVDRARSDLRAALGS